MFPFLSCNKKRKEMALKKRKNRSEGKNDLRAKAIEFTLHLKRVCDDHIDSIFFLFLFCDSENR